MNDLPESDFDDLEAPEGDFSDDGSSYTPIANPPLGHPRVVKEETVEKYFSYVKTLHKQYLASSEEAREREVMPVDLVDFLMARAPYLRPKTFINYRCGLLYWLGTLPETPDTYQARLALHVATPHAGFKGPKPNTTSTLYTTSSIRPRTFARKKFDRLIAELNKRAAPSEDVELRRRPTELMLWLLAGLASGLRPVEWETAQWHDMTKGELRVITAKRKTGTSTLPTIFGMPPPAVKERIVVIDPDDRIWVMQHMASVKRHLATGAPFSAYYNNNRVYLWSVCRELFGDAKPAITLYMMRGQFAANRKRRGEPREEVAASMGCSAGVSSSYYGNRSHGHRSVSLHVRDKNDAEKSIGDRIAPSSAAKV